MRSVATPINQSPKIWSTIVSGLEYREHTYLAMVNHNREHMLFLCVNIVSSKVATTRIHPVACQILDYEYELLPPKLHFNRM